MVLDNNDCDTRFDKKDLKQFRIRKVDLPIEKLLKAQNPD